jgi:hypothetical protein
MEKGLLQQGSGKKRGLKAASETIYDTKVYSPL